MALKFDQETIDMTIDSAMKTLLLISMLLVLAACRESNSADAEDLNNGKASPAAFTVYKNPSCGCCGLWVKHMENAGFQLKTKDLDDITPIKRDFDIGLSQQSCHTAVWDDGETRYVFEGHIPATLVQRFLNERPEDAQGLLVPGMPVGSPGMEHGDMRMPYDVLLLKNGGSTEVYAHIDDNGNISLQ